MLARMWRKGNPSALLVGMQTGAATVENSMEFPQKTKSGSASDPAIPLREIYLKELKTSVQNNSTNTPIFIAASFTIAMLWKQPKCPSVDEWIKQLWDIYTLKYYSAVTKKKVLSFGTVWMDLENIMLSEISQVVRDKYHMISPLTGT